MNRKTIRAGIVVSALALVPMPLSAASISIQGGSNVEVQVIDHIGYGGDAVTHNPSATPFPYQTSDSVTASYATASAVYNLNSQSLRFDFSGSYAAGNPNTGNTNTAYFGGEIAGLTVSADTPYSLSGVWTETGGSSLADWPYINNGQINPYPTQMLHSVYIYDVSTGQTLYSYSLSSPTPTTSTLSGDGLTGTLLAGQQYTLFYEYDVSTGAAAQSDYAANGGTGSGFLELDVPEPQVLGMFGTVASIVLLFRRRTDVMRRHSSPTTD